MYVHILGGGCSEEGYGRNITVGKVVIRRSERRRKAGRERRKKRVEKRRTETDLRDKTGEEKQ